ncbi:MAG: helix-turn-helix transcriptional regulator [Bacteroides sp.]|nr:helix-turn-helix transcriptional regulator [Bacteroides sp.]
MELHDRLKEIRKDLNLSQEEFSERLGLKQGSYSDIERGKTKNISGTILRLIENLYGVNPDWIISGEGEKK